MAKQVEDVPLLLFGEYRFDTVDVHDDSLSPYISLKPVYLPWSGGRHEHKRFQKSDLNIVERLVNKMMRHGKMGGKKAKAISILKSSFRIVSQETDENPIQVLVRAIENSAPAEDVTTISYGGARYHVSVDVAPQRRVDVALKHIADGARRAVRGKPLAIERALAQEIVNASRGDSSSFAISKKIEKERIAVSAR
jgi:small subunit ribosomal protein S7